MELLKFEKEYRVNVYETGPGGKLSLYSLFNYMQDIASDHAEILGFGRDDLMRDNHFWVLSRIYAEIADWPSWEDRIIVRTWPNGTDKIFALRNFEIMYSDGRKIGNATSSWLILDRETKKIQRPETITARHNFPLPDEFPLRNPGKLDTAGEQGETSFCFRIRTSDLDVNLHTNNTAYLRWVNDDYDFGFIMKNDPSSVEINYLAESKYNEEITIRTTAELCNTFAHSIFRLNDGKELCRLKLKWKEQ
jgi:acyl-ACP thioesterase